MRQATVFVVSLILVLSSAPVFAQQFTVEPDSLEGVGVRDKLHEFDAKITNLWDQQNKILWSVDTDIPEGWTLEVCQGSLLCWPPWVESDTLSLEAEAFDTLLIKFRTAADADGVGSTTIHLVALSDPDIQQEYTFTLTVGAESVDDKGRLTTNGSNFQFKPNYISSGSVITLPYSSFGSIRLYDMMGRLSNKIWAGHLQAGENFVNPNLSPLPAGQYIMHLNVDGIGALESLSVILCK